MEEYGLCLAGFLFWCVFGLIFRSLFSFLKYCIAVLAEKPNGNEVIIEDGEGDGEEIAWI